MIDIADVLVGFRTYPHIDFYETGERAAGVLLEMIGTGRRFAPVHRRIPMIVPIENAETSSGPFSWAFERIVGLESANTARTVSIFCPHPWLDVADMGIVILEYPESYETAASCEIAADEVEVRIAVQ